MTMFFNALHAPIGAHASFTLGCKGASGGLGLEMGGPAGEEVYIGCETRAGGSYQALPFFAGSTAGPGAAEADRYDHAGGARRQRARLRPFADRAIRRDCRLGTDIWSAGDLTFTVYSPVRAVPDPAATADTVLAEVLCPAVVAELVLDNRQGSRPRTAFFGYTGANRPDSMRRFDDASGAGLTGVAHGRSTAIATTDRGATAAQGFSMEAILTERHEENYTFGLGGTGALLITAPPGRRKILRVAICFHRAGAVTGGIEASYYYQRFFPDLESVAHHAVAHHAAIVKAAKLSDKMIARPALSEDQRFQLMHAIRSYYGSTQLLDWDGAPFWVVNEGEYRMMNTFDLTVDQLFFEMKLNPWTVRNELDVFTDRYSYTDRLHFPGGANEHPGGIAFTHDMGMGNHVSRPGYSTYEKFGLSGCFSHMTHEQLVNWVLCAAVYVHGSGDQAWLKRRKDVFAACLESMCCRDHPDPAQRNGVMGLDSSRTLDGAEITTYDSLDASLGQSRNNVYMAVKCWAAYLALERLLGGEASRCAGSQAQRCAATVVAHVEADGTIPAIMGEPCQARIIPAIEGLVFPWALDMEGMLADQGPYGDLIKALRRHLGKVLRKGVCLYDDGAWKLSSTADNSWLSKIYLSQFVARKILGRRQDAAMKRTDRAHVRWLLKEENLFFAWSDQMVSGVAKGSKYYPRGVTAILWLEE